MSQTQTNRPKRSHVFLLKLTLGIFVLIFIAMIVMNYMKSKGIADFLANQGETPSPVTAMTITTQQWTPVIETTGLVRPNQGAMLSAQSAGTISKVLVTNGQNVKKGDLIVKDEEILNYGNFEIYLKNKTNKKYVVTDYKKIYNFLYKFRKVIAFFGYPEMPEINKISNFLYMDFVLKDKNADEKKNKNEFRKAVKFIQNKGYNCKFFMIGSYENSFLEKNLDKMKVFKYKSKMYKVFYEEIENTEIDNKFKSENIEISFWNL